MAEMTARRLSESGAVLRRTVSPTARSRRWARRRSTATGMTWAGSGAAAAAIRKRAASRRGAMRSASPYAAAAAEFRLRRAAVTGAEQHPGKVVAQDVAPAAE